MTDLPALTAHHPQLIRHGEHDRAEVLGQIDATIRATAGQQPAELVDQLIAIYREVALRHTNALWWGEQSGRHIGRVLQRELTADDKARIAALAARR
ncbi:hypothetical protein [Rhizomonospora bruguierae]|uniref:hypothetical protein n=1 Tax=Rhizomonospora bruguierae TaxID=1581705 RepID=UPI001BD11576|nr:hypothetical protein [Micromonospora sp. NBRC 107566]